MRCPRCQFDNPPVMHFCVECGARLERRCPQCGAEAQPTFKFCGQSGAALEAPGPAGAPASLEKTQVYRNQETKIPSYIPRHLAEKILTARSALEGERRQVTVLFADMANFTTLAAQLDPEDVHQIIDACFARITAEVHRFEGTINQYTGDGVMALFGAPIAHEDGPRRAVHAALGIQRAVWEYGQALQAERLQTPREIWLGKSALGKVFARLGRENDAEAHFIQATQTIEAIADRLQTPSLRRSFLDAEPVVDLYQTLGQRPPPALP